ncbi:MAG: alpha/beta fold hydrolase [Verrucomicrobiota bacterium]
MALLIVIFGVTSIAAFFYFVQDRIIYLPQAYARPHGQILAQELRTGRKNRLLSFQTSQGQQQAVYFGEDRAQKVWLMFGGNGARALDWLALIRRVPVEADVGFLLIDYPGYGWSEGRPDPRTIQQSVAGALLLLADEWELPLDDLEKSLSCMGHSLGAAVALEVAVERGVREVVVISPFTTMAAMAERVVGKPIAYLLRHRFDNVKSLQALQKNEQARVVMFHGEEDKMIPYAMGQSLGRDFAGLVTFHPVQQAGHNDILSHIDGQLIQLLAAE